jgi:hypothetical protein
MIFNKSNCKLFIKYLKIILKEDFVANSFWDVNYILNNIFTF